MQDFLGNLLGDWIRRDTTVIVAAIAGFLGLISVVALGNWAAAGLMNVNTRDVVSQELLTSWSCS